MARTVKVAIAGLGPVGQAVARAVLQTPGLKLVAAADPSPPPRTALPEQLVLGRERYGR